MKCLHQKLTLLLAFLTVFIISISHTVHARHKCPKVPAPPGVMGVLSSSTLIPSGSTMAAARSSETFGCDLGHPSENFYKPKNKRVTLFLKDNFMQLKLESAQGHGKHLVAMANLAGCTSNGHAFAKLVRKNYVHVFDDKLSDLYMDTSIKLASKTSERILNLISNSPLLASRCESS